MKLFLYSVGLVGLGALIAFLFQVAVDKNSVVECNKWREQAATIENFYLVAWQGAQCEAVGVKTGAIIISPCKVAESGKSCQQRLGEQWEVIEYPSGLIRGERM